jgi:ketosteroid isomerase-like protein
MPEESRTPGLIELLRGALETANRGDIDGLMRAFAPDAVFEGRALGDVFEGGAAIRAFIEEWLSTYDELKYVLEEAEELGNEVLFAVVVQRGRLAGSDASVEQREGWVLLFEGGLLARITFSEVDEGRALAERLAGAPGGRA